MLNNVGWSSVSWCVLCINVDCDKRKGQVMHALQRKKGYNGIKDAMEGFEG